MPDDAQPIPGDHQLISRDPDLRADDYLPALWVPLSRLTTARRRILTMVRQLPAPAWQAPSACPGWSRRDLLAHLVSWDAQHRRSLDAIRAGNPLTADSWLPDDQTPALTQDDWNAREIAASASTAVDELGHHYETGLLALLERLAALDQDQLLRAYGFAANALAAVETHVRHINQHADDIINGPTMMR